MPLNYAVKKLKKGPPITVWNQKKILKSIQKQVILS